jgi:hypothetical protein
MGKLKPRLYRDIHPLQCETSFQLCGTLCQLKTSFATHPLLSLTFFLEQSDMFAPYQLRIMLVSPLTAWTEENEKMGRWEDGEIKARVCIEIFIHYYCVTLFNSVELCVAIF